MLTRKDFINFAKGISEIDDDMVREQAINTQMIILRQTNPRFDEQRFRDFIRDKVRERRVGNL